MTIQCTNPTCRTTIQVPEGVSYVVCPVCNTWHFPADFDNASGSDSSPFGGAMDYGLPDAPPPPPTPPPVIPEAPVQNSSFPQYQAEEVAIPVFAPDFHKPVEKAAEQGPRIGQLILADGSVLQLRQGVNTFGRKCGELSIDDPTVSRKHCVIEVNPKAGGGWSYLLYDIGAVEGKASTNGVFVEGRSLRLQNYEKIPVYNQSVIFLGNVKIALQCP